MPPRPSPRSKRVLVGAVASLAGLAVCATATIPAGAQEPSPGISVPPATNAFPVPLPHAATFGDDWHACRDGCSRLHKGNDIFAAEGTPEVAVESGVIADVDDTDDGNGGLSLWLLGDSGVAYYYAHNAANLVVEGQRVARGQVIGRVGRTGNARTTPPHIHFQINVCGELSSDEPCTIDPRAHLLRWRQGLVDGGADALGWYRPSDAVFRLRSDGGSALPTLRAAGRPPSGPGDALPVAGDWDGDGRDTVGVYRRSDGVAVLMDEEGRVADRIGLGERGRDALPVAGDWDGDGSDTLGLYVRRTATFVLHREHGPPVRTIVGPARRPDTLPVAGDWDGDGRDTVGVYLRGRATFLLGHGDGAVTTSTLGPRGTSDTFPVAGDWDGDGRDAPGLYRRGTSAFLLEGPSVVPARPVGGRPGGADGTRAAAVAAASGSPSVRPPTGSVAAGAGTPLPVGPQEVGFGRPGQADALPVAGDWNGRDPVTLDDLRQIYDLRDAERLAADMPFLNAAMLSAGATTPARKAAFLATVRNESGFRADAIEPGRGRYRGRGFIQLTGDFNYERAGDDLGLDLVGDPDLAANPLVSAAVASWYWTVARNINVAADHLDMAAVGIAVGYAPRLGEDAERCRDFVAALRYFDAGRTPDGVNCERTPLSYVLALSPSAAPAAPSSPGAVDPGTRPPTGRPGDPPDGPPVGPPSTRPPTSRPPSTTTTTAPPPPPPSRTTTTTTAPPPSTTTTTTPPSPTTTTTAPPSGEPPSPTTTTTAPPPSTPPSEPTTTTTPPPGEPSTTTTPPPSEPTTTTTPPPGEPTTTTAAPAPPSDGSSGEGAPADEADAPAADDGSRPSAPDDGSGQAAPGSGRPAPGAAATERAGRAVADRRTRRPEGP